MQATSYYSEENQGPHEFLDLGKFALESGEHLPNCSLAYKTRGTLNNAKDNAILFPHMWSGTSKSMESLIGEDRPLDPRRYFIILPGQFGNGISSSPSNTPAPHNAGAFPNFSIADDVKAQHMLLTRRFEIEKIALVLGWSMGAQQTYEWAIQYPDMVQRALPIAGFAKVTPHNFLFVRAHEDALKSDPAYNGGFYKNSSDVALGLRRHAQIWSVMGLCQEFYKQEVWRSMGFTSLDDFVAGFWEAYFAPMDPNNLIWMATKWRHGDSSRVAGGDLATALGRIKAKTHVVAFSNDMFFPPSDCKAEQLMIPNSHFKLVQTLWAHFAMFGISANDRDQIDDCIRSILAEPV